MKTWIVSLLDEETIQGEETTQGRKLYEKYGILKYHSHKNPKNFAFIKHENIFPNLFWRNKFKLHTGVSSLDFVTGFRKK